MDYLSANFTLSELIKSPSALRAGIINVPDSMDIVSNLALLCKNILEPVRAHFELPIFINSGYRNNQVNKLVGGQETSKHVTGQAVDFEVPNVSNYEVACFIRDNLPHDQVILEYYTPGIPNSGWVHCSFLVAGNRHQDLTCTHDGKTLQGLVG